MEHVLFAPGLLIQCQTLTLSVQVIRGSWFLVVLKIGSRKPKKSRPEKFLTATSVSLFVVETCDMISAKALCLKGWRQSRHVLKAYF